MNLFGNNMNKITGKKYQPVMSITGLNDQGLCSEIGRKTAFLAVIKLEKVFKTLSNHIFLQISDH